MDIKSGSIELIAQVDLAHEPDFCIGSLTVHPSLRKIQMPDETISLEPRVMQVFVALARTQGEVVSKWDLIQTCWEGREVGDDAISRCIAAIRRFADGGDLEVTTIPRVGYRLTEVPGSMPASTDDADAGAAPNSSTEGSHASRWSRGWTAWAAAIVAIGLAGIAYWFGIARSDSSAKLLSVAVLPLDTNTTDPAHIAYARDVSARLAAKIAPLGLEVASPTQSAHFTGEKKPDAYSKLPTTFIIDGNVTREDDKIRITVHFDNRASREVLFSKSFEAPQSEAARLGERVSAIMADRMRNIAAIDPARPDQAREMFTFWEASRNGDPVFALAQLRKIVGESPDRRELRLMHADANAFQIAMSPLGQRRERYREALSLYDEVKDFDPGNVAHAKVQFWLTPASDWARREAVLRKGQNSPTGGGAVQWGYGMLLLESGYLVEAASRLHSAVQNDPNFFITIYDAANAHRLIQRWDLAEQILDDYADTVVEAPHDALLQSMRVTIAKEARDFDKVRRIQSAGPLAQVKSNDLSKVNKLVFRADETRKPGDIAAAIEACRTVGFPYQIFGHCLPILSENGELDLAFAQLNRVIPDLSGASKREREDKWFSAMDMPFSRFSIPQIYHPRNAAIRADPRFIDLARKLDLIDYWRIRGAPDFCLHEAAPVCSLIGQATKGIRG